MPRPLRAACTPTTLTLNLEEKSMKKLYALLVVAGLCAEIIGAAARADDEVDVGDIVAVTDERFTDHQAINLGHGLLISCIAMS